MVIRVLIVSTILILSFFSASSAFATLTLNEVGTVKAGHDYATNKFSDSWDMSNREDVWPVYTNINNASFSGGKFSGTAATKDPQVYFLWGGYPDSIASPRDGSANPINANYYNRVAIRFFSSTAGEAELFWFYSKDIKRSLKRQEFKVDKGWNIYIFDSAYTAFNKNWKGSPIGLRLDPINVSGANFSIDWVSVYRTNTSTANLSWTPDPILDGNYEVYVESDNSGEDWLAQTFSTEATVDLAALRSGVYNLYVRRTGASPEDSNPVAVKVNDAPVVNIIEPDAAGGQDWAAEFLGDAWDMSNSKDISSTRNITARRFSNGVFTARNTGVGGAQANDPIVYLNLRGKKIDAYRYHRLTIRYRYDQPFSLVRGTMARMGWKLYPYKSWQMTNDILTYDGWNTITLSLRGASLDKGTMGWRGQANYLRFDPHEDPYARRFYIDYVKLARDDLVRGGYFDIKYKLIDSDSAGIAYEVYADKDKNPGNGNERRLTVGSAGPGERVYRWSPDGSFNGSYNIYVSVNDGLNSTVSYSTGPVYVDNYRPRVYGRRTTVRRTNNKAKERRYHRLYRAYKSKYKKATNLRLRRRYLSLARKYFKAYRKAKVKYANIKLPWYVKDLYGDNAAYVKLKIKKRVVSKSRARKRARYIKLYKSWKAKYRKTRNRTLRRRYYRAASWYYSAYRKINPYGYRTVKTPNYGWTGINAWKHYTWRTRSGGTYRYYVYAKDYVGHSQVQVAGNYLIIK